MPEPVPSEARPGAQETSVSADSTHGRGERENDAKKGSNEWKEMKSSGSGVSTTEFSSGHGAGARCGRILAQRSLAHG